MNVFLICRIWKDGSREYFDERGKCFRGPTNTASILTSKKDAERVIDTWRLMEINTDIKIVTGRLSVSK